MCVGMIAALEFQCELPVLSLLQEPTREGDATAILQQLFKHLEKRRQDPPSPPSADAIREGAERVSYGLLACIVVSTASLSI